MRVFLSYRRDDAGGYAGRLTDALLQHLGPRSVFQDVTAISPGQDYTVAIDRALADSDAVLAVIGPGWLTAVTPQGVPRLLEAGDYVRLELARALERDIRVIPVIVGGARLPEAAELPDDLRELAQRQALELRNENWHQDVDGLVRSLRGLPAVPARRQPRRLAVGTALIVLVALGAGAWWLWGPGTGGQTGTSGQTGTGGPTGSAEPASCVHPVGQAWNPVTLGKNPKAREAQDPNYPVTITVREAYWRAHGGKWQVILATTVENVGQQTTTMGSWKYQHLIVAQRYNDVTCFTSTHDTIDPGIIDDERVGFDVNCKPTGRLVLQLDSGSISVTPETQDWGSC